MAERAAAGLIYALDLAVNTGVAVGLPGDRPNSFTLELKRRGEHPAAALAALLKWLTDDWSEVRPALVVKEAPLHLEGFALRRNAEVTVRMQYGMHAIVEALGVRFGIPVHEVEAQSVRKHFLSVSRTGDRAATKAAVLSRCWTLGYLPRSCHDDNRADACATWDWAVAHLCRKPPRELVMFGER